MLKGKTILASSSITSSTASTENIDNLLKPSKRLTSNLTNHLEPKIINQSKIIQMNSLESEYDSKRNLYFSLEYMKSKINSRDYNDFYFLEVTDILKGLDSNFNEQNIDSNIQKFANVGTGIQERLSNVGSILDFLTKENMSTVKEHFSEKYSGFLNKFKTVQESDFNEFNSKIKKLKDSYIEIYNIKNKKEQYFKDFNRLYFYYDFFKFIATELVHRNILSAEEIPSTVIASRINSLFGSIRVLEQFKDVYEFEIKTRELEYSNIENYLNTLMPSFELLLHNDTKKFQEVFKQFLIS